MSAAPGPLMLTDNEDIEETLSRLQRECREEANELGPSFSYGCARTSGVTVCNKKREGRIPRHLRSTSSHTSDPHVTGACRHFKRTERQETRSPIRSKKKAASKRPCPKTAKTKQKLQLRICFKPKSASRQTKERGDRGCFSCDECGDAFTFKNNLRRHQELHKVASNEYRCNECGKTFSAKRNLSRHLKSHEPLDPEDRSYFCDKCDKSFHRAKYLYHHQKVHDVARPYACQMCPKSFKTRYNLQSHEAIHLNCKEFVCQFCGMAFTRSSYRTIHERIHTKEKPFRCDQCSKSFIRGDHLKSHKKVHGK